MSAAGAALKRWVCCQVHEYLGDACPAHCDSPVEASDPPASNPPAGAPKERGPVNLERARICLLENDRLTMEYDWLVERGRRAEARKVIDSQRVLLDQARRDLGN